MKTWLMIAAAVIITAGIVYLGGQAFDSGESAETTPSNHSTTQSEAPENGLILLETWQGTGTKTTEPFTISQQPWVISWVNEPQMLDGQSIGSLQIIVYNSEQPDTPVALAANTQADETDSSYVYETGTFYLTVNAANTSWEVSVFEPQ